MAQAATDMKHGGRFHMDDRGIRYCDIFPEIGKGDINVSVIEPEAAAMWHRHRQQADYQLVIKGSLKIGMCNMPNTGFDFFRPDDVVKSIEDYQAPFVAEWPQIKEKYGLLKNKGYATKIHINGIKEHGYSPYHRKSFKLKNI